MPDGCRNKTYSGGRIRPYPFTGSCRLFFLRGNLRDIDEAISAAMDNANSDAWAHGGGKYQGIDGSIYFAIDTSICTEDTDIYLSPYRRLLPDIKFVYQDFFTEVDRYATIDVYIDPGIGPSAIAHEAATCAFKRNGNWSAEMMFEKYGSARGGLKLTGPIEMIRINWRVTSNPQKRKAYADCFS